VKRGDLVMLQLSPTRSAQARRALQGGWARVVEQAGGMVLVTPPGSSGEAYQLTIDEVRPVG
jgi:hypothetical protein